MAGTCEYGDEPSGSIVVVVVGRACGAYGGGERGAQSSVGET